ncbi:MAG: 30S ribosomal protein S15 [Candidatus Kaiserbacteria bacterium]|nr:30S ribosomal protein S15 [Candidatus Kaiserbacteria bacterium]
MLTKEEKQKQIEAARMHDSDTGSSAVQVSILSSRIQQMNNHLKNNHKDRHSRRGLVGLVEQRRKHLSYIKRKNSKLYESIVEKLGLRK